MARQRRPPTNPADGGPPQKAVKKGGRWLGWRSITLVVAIALCAAAYLAKSWQGSVEDDEKDLSSEEHLERFEKDLASAKAILLSNPKKALYVLRERLRRGIGFFRIEEKIKLLDALGDAYGVMRQYDSAEQYHKEALKMRKNVSAGSAQMAISHAALATDLLQQSKLEKALKHVQRAQKLPGLPQEALSVLLRQESFIHECNEEFVPALNQFEQAIKMVPASGAENMLKHYELLKKTLAASSDSMPKEVREAMTAQLDKTLAAMLSEGPWERQDQLPRSFLPGLTAQPWHTLENWEGKAAWMTYARAAAREASVVLLKEYGNLERGGFLHREAECIHDQMGGDWMHFEVNGVWEERDDDGCAIVAPNACALFKTLKKKGMPLIRAGYSSVGAGAWLRPHNGMTNGQLKWHLGLNIPDGDCAKIRVGNETKTWPLGDVLFFDDSFEHEVWNRCETERVVFQLVFLHPDLTPQRQTEQGMSITKETLNAH